MRFQSISTSKYVDLSAKNTLMANVNVGKKSIRFKDRWALFGVIAGLSPYYAKQFDYYSTTGLANLAYYLTIVVVVLVGGALLSYRNIRLTVIRNLISNPLIIFYISWLLIGQLLFVISYGSLGESHWFRTAGYATTAFISFAVLPSVLWQNSLRNWWSLLLIVGSTVSLFALYVAFTGNTELFGLRLMRRSLIVPLGIFESAGLFHETNTFGLVASLGLISAGYFLTISTGIYQKTICMLLLMICAGGVLVSWSRGVWLGLALSIPIWHTVGMSFKGKLVYVYTIVWIFFLTYFSWFQIHSSSAFPFFDEIFQTSIGLAGRNILWRAAIQAILEKPLLGHGLDTGSLLDAIYTYGGSSYIYNKDATLAAHNTFLDLGVQTGIIPPFLHLGIIFWSLVRLINSSINLTTKRALAIAITVSTCASMFIPYSIGGASYAAQAVTILFGLASTTSTIKNS